MSSGEDLVVAFRKLRCPEVENIDADSLDWHFEDPELAIYLKEFCSRVTSGHLQAAGKLSSSIHSRPELTCQSILSQDAKDDARLKEEIKRKEHEVERKRDCAALLRKKLDLVRKQNAKADSHISSREKATKKNNLKLSSLKSELEPEIRHFAELEKVLADSNSKLLAFLAEPNNNTSDSSSKSICSQTSKYESYVENEKVLLEQLDELAEIKMREPDKEVDSEAQQLVQEWRNEQLRLQKCFTMTLWNYNYARTAETVLQKGIELLQKATETTSSAKDVLGEAQKSSKSFKSMTRSEIESMCEDACENLASKAMSPLLLVNYKIKLQRLEQYVADQNEVLDLLRNQQCRLSLFQLSQNLEAKRRTKLHTLCQNITANLKKTKTSREEWIVALRSLKESQKPKMTKLVPDGDQAMETVAKVLGSDPGLFIPTFDGIVQAAMTASSNVEASRSTNTEDLDLILDKINELESLGEVLNQTQEPLTATTEYHGNLNLVQAMTDLKSNIKLYTATVLDTQNSFKKFENDLMKCEREVFERTQKMEIALQKISRQE